LNRPMKNAIYPVYPEDKPRIITALKSLLAAYEAEKERKSEDIDDTDRSLFVDREILELTDLIHRLEKLP